MSETITGQSLDVVEATVLLHLNRHPNNAAVRAALGLLAMVGGIKRAAPVRSFWGGSIKLDVLALSGEQLGRLHPGAAAVYAALGGGGGSEPVAYAPTEVLARLQKAFGVSYQTLLDSHVLPALTQRGLIESVTKPRLKFFSSTRLEPTPAGAALLAELRTLKTEANSIAPMVKRDPQGAALKCMQLGTALLLADNLSRHMKKLSAVAGASLAGGEVARIVDDADSDRRRNWLDGGDLFATLDWASVFDAIDGAFDAADAGGADGGDGGGE